MGRLFWKFFLTFWLALLVAGAGVGIAVWVRHKAEQVNTGDQHHQSIASEHAMALLDVAESALRYGGVNELRNFLGKSGRTAFSLIYAVDDQNQEILQRALDPEALTQARELYSQGSNPKMVKLVSTADGHHYMLFTLAHPEFGPHRQHPGFSGPPPDQIPPPPSPLWPILAGTFASLIFSAALAWYFAKPIRHLRNAFSALSHGDLDARIGTSMGQRRDELADLGRDFDHMANQIHNLVHAQQRLLHDVSHELRSPLARIQAAIGLAQQSPEKQQSILVRIERESQRINELVGELLMLSRLEAGVAGGESQEFDIGELLDAIVEDARFEAEQRQVLIRYDGIGETLVKCRGELLHRAFENVLRNALQHCKPSAEVSVSASFGKDTRLLSVTIDDDGPGVTEQDLSAIFEPFFRSGDRGKTNGMGLGLAIAYRAIAAHGGTIAASNRPGHGLSMKINIPFAE